jgi:hypothetical protein
MKVNRPKPGLRQPILSYHPDELPRTEPEALSSLVPVEQPPLLSRKWWKKNWKKVAVAGLVPLSAGSGFTNPLVPAATSTSPRTSTVTPMRTAQTQQVFSHSIFTRDLLDGGHYTFNGPWQAKAGTDGHAAALELASSVVDVANKCAGPHWLPPEVRRYLIQLVLLGIGGVDPDDAGDILELAAENADDPQLARPKLEPLITALTQRVALAQHDSPPFPATIWQTSEAEPSQSTPWVTVAAEPLDHTTRLWNLITHPAGLSAEGTMLASEPGSPLTQPTDWPTTSYGAPDHEETD